MAHRHTQNEEDFDNYDPTPYEGGYNQAEVYGSIKPADAATAYAPAESGDVPEGTYGHEDSPYGAGRGASAHQRTEAQYESAQPDYQGGAPPFGGRKPRHDEESHGEDFDSRREQQDHGYRKPIPAYGENEEASEYRGEYGEQQRLRHSRPSYEQQPPRSYGEQQEQEWGGEQNEGSLPSYGRPHHEHHGEQQEGYRGGRRQGEYTSEYPQEEDAPQRPSYW